MTGHRRPHAPREECISRSEMPTMTGLLVSVRSAAEAETALAGGADIIDVKEPRNGPLGPADPAVWDEVRSVVAGRAMTSAALGELLAEGIEQLASQARGLCFAKIGLAGCHSQRGWLARWFDVVNALPPGVNPVPVAYADWPAAAAPAPSVALALAAQSPSRLLLIDTYDKTSGGLLDHLALDSLRELAQDASASQVRLVLAGSLHVAAIASLLALAPDYFGVRGAACRGGRSGTIVLARVKSLSRLVHGTRHKVAL
jgi:(5-formylfuran-3-yl)methyl phosphate synthase